MAVTVRCGEMIFLEKNTFDFASGTKCCRGSVSTCQGCFVQHSLTVDFSWEITQNKKRLHTRTDAETCAFLQASHCACQHVDMKAQPNNNKLPGFSVSAR